MQITEFSLEQIESLRDRTYHRNKYLQIKSIDAALDFINAVGFCFAFSARNWELPCLWHAACGQRTPQMPRHTHHDPHIGLVWEAKDVLPAKKLVYYGKVLKKSPTFISLEFFPYFYALIAGQRGPDGYLSDFLDGTLSTAAKNILDSLNTASPQITRDLKLSSGLSHPKQRYEFDQAIAELQAKMYLLKVAEFYEPFTFLWDLVLNQFPAIAEQAAPISRKMALGKILSKYFEVVWVADVTQIQRVFGWDKNEIGGVIEELVTEGLLTAVPRAAGKFAWHALEI
jgi:hypothetical protein